MYSRAPGLRANGGLPRAVAGVHGVSLCDTQVNSCDFLLPISPLLVHDGGLNSGSKSGKGSHEASLASSLHGAHACLDTCMGAVRSRGDRLGRGGQGG